VARLPIALRRSVLVLGFVLPFAAFSSGCASAPEPEAAETASPPQSDLAFPAASPDYDDAYLQAALQTAEWIRSTALVSDVGTAWPVDPLDTAQVATNLYSGTPGVVLFFIEVWRATGDSTFLDDARAGADYLAASLAGPEETFDAGLYTGVAGIAYVLWETFEATGDEAYRAAAIGAVDRIIDAATPSGSGLAWSSSTDIISGTSGIGLLLLYAADEAAHPRALAAAEGAGRGLLDLADRVDGGSSWRMSPDYPRLMPNFSHGTAGVAYFLARVYEETGEADYLQAAISGGRYLQSIAETEGDVCLVFHNDDGGEDLFYLNWCHGPAGTGRTFYQLARTSGDDEWPEWLDRSANALTESGIPEQRTDGFWNNVGQCCGNAGVAEFFISLYALSGDRAHLEFARRLADDLLSGATSGEPGLMWAQAEHRVRPDFLVAQTGYMQGASGIGLLLLHLDGALAGRPPAIVLPDSPFVF